MIHRRTIEGVSITFLLLMYPNADGTQHALCKFLKADYIRVRRNYNVQSFIDHNQHHSIGMRNIQGWQSLALRLAPCTNHDHVNL